MSAQYYYKNYTNKETGASNIQLSTDNNVDIHSAVFFYKCTWNTHVFFSLRSFARQLFLPFEYKFNQTYLVSGNKKNAIELTQINLYMYLLNLLVLLLSLMLQL